MEATYHYTVSKIKKGKILFDDVVVEMHKGANERFHALFFKREKRQK